MANENSRPDPHGRTKATARKSTGGAIIPQAPVGVLRAVQIKKLSSTSSHNSTPDPVSSPSGSSGSSTPTVKATSRKSTATRIEPLPTSRYRIRRIQTSTVQKHSVGPVERFTRKIERRVDRFHSAGSQRYGQGIGKGGLRRLAEAVQNQKDQELKRQRKQQAPRRKRRSDGLDGLADFDRPRKSIPRGPFLRLIKQLMAEWGNYKVQVAALDALQEIAEGYLVRLFDTSSLLTSHAGRVTLFTKDIDLARRVTTPGNYEAPL